MNISKTKELLKARKFYLIFLALTVIAVSLVVHAETVSTYFYKVQYPNQVNQLFREINPQTMWDQLVYLTSFRDRAVVHESGRESAYWIKNQLELWTKESKRNDVTISLTLNSR